jgi:outer membrane protein assembly factor BamB
VEDGEELWKAPWSTAYDANVATPLFVPEGGLFISTGYDTGAALLQVRLEEEGFKAYQVWRNRVMRNHFNNSIRVGGHLYGFDESILKCVDVLSGEEQWKGRAGSKGSLVYVDGHLLVLGGNGTLSLVEATAEGFRSKAEARITDDRTWAVPALSDGVLYIRAWGELVALRVAAP